MRSVYLNLKDKNNPDLRAAVVSGAIDGKLLWSMSVQDLASAEKKKELAALTKEALFSAQGAAPKKSETDMFECGKCKKRGRPTTRCRRARRTRWVFFSRPELCTARLALTLPPPA